MSERERNADIKFNVVEHIGVIKEYPTGWSKELNIVSWNGGAAKYDIRDWDHTHERMSRGITLHEEELIKILHLMRARKSKQQMAEQQSAQDVQQTAQEN